MSQMHSHRDPALCYGRFDPTADIFGVKKSYPNADITAKNHGPALRYKMRTWRLVGSDVRSVCGHLWDQVAQKNKE